MFRAKSTQFLIDFALKPHKTGEIYMIFDRFRPKYLHDLYIHRIFAKSKQVSLWIISSEEMLKSAG